MPSLHRALIAAAAGSLLIVAVTVSARGGEPGCSLAAVRAASDERDALSAVVPSGRGVIAVGTRYSGSAGGAVTIAATEGTWDPQVVRSVPGHAVTLDDVAVDGDGAWAVGAIEDLTPIVERWDGAAWADSPIADPGPGEDGLSGVDAVSPGLAWAVGRHQTGADFVTLVERWDGTAWRPVASPNAGSSDMLKDVAAVGTGDAWAVGWSIQAGRYRPLAMRWNGTAWLIVPTAPLPAGDAVLAGIAATGPDDVWAVGWIGRGDAVRPLVERWDGRAWAVVPPPAGSSQLLAVDATSEGVVVAGRRFEAQRVGPMAAVRTGGAWTDVAVPSQAPSWLTGVTRDAGGTLWAVGISFPDNSVTTAFVVSGCAPS